MTSATIKNIRLTDKRAIALAVARAKDEGRSAAGAVTRTLIESLSEKYGKKAAALSDNAQGESTR